MHMYKRYNVAWALILIFLCSACFSSEKAIFCHGELVNDLSDFYNKVRWREFVLPSGGLYNQYYPRSDKDMTELNKITNLPKCELNTLKFMDDTYVDAPHILSPFMVQLTHSKDQNGKRHIEGICVLFQETLYPPVINPFAPPHKLEFTNFYDKFYSNLDKFPFLRHLELYSFVMQKKHITALSKLGVASKLKYLGMPNNYSDSDLKEISDFNQLEYINASATRIKGGGFKYLSNLSKLKTLDLRRNQFDHATLSGLKKVKLLTTLLLSDTNIGDGDLKDISELNNLNYLTLHGTQITDKGLIHLTKIKNLKYVSLFNTKTTTLGRDNLINKNSHLVIDVNSPQKMSVFLNERNYISAYLGGRHNQFRLANYYSKNNTDLVESLKWYIILEAGNSKVSSSYPEKYIQIWQKKAKQEIRRLKNTLELNQIEEAEKRAKSFILLSKISKYNYDIIQDNELPVYQYGFDSIWNYEN